jgi:hypothetical protein
VRRIGAIGLVVAAMLALPGQAGAAGWSAPRDLATEQSSFSRAPQVEFSSRGLAVASGRLGVRPYVARRRPGREFSRPRLSPAIDLASFAPVADPDGGGALFGTYLSYSAEHSDIRDDCCDRVGWIPMSNRARLGGVRPLSRHGAFPGAIQLNTDGRGGAGAVWNDGQWAMSTRRRSGEFAAPTTLDPPADMSEGSMVTRPSGWTFAATPDPRRLGVRVYPRRPGGGFGPAVSTGTVSPESSLRVGTVRLEAGRRGHVWVLWELTSQRFDRPRTRIVAAARRSDGSIGPARTLARSAELYDSEATVDDGGTLHFVAEHVVGPVDLTSVARSGRLAGVKRLARRGSGAEVDAAGNGRVVVAWRVSSRLMAIDRLPGGRFGAARRLDGGLGSTYYGHQVSVGPGRESIVTWSKTARDFSSTAVRYAVLTR